MIKIKNLALIARTVIMVKKQSDKFLRSIVG